MWESGLQASHFVLADVPMPVLPASAFEQRPQCRFSPSPAWFEANRTPFMKQHAVTCTGRTTLSCRGGADSTSRGVATPRGAPESVRRELRPRLALGEGLQQAGDDRRLVEHEAAEEDRQADCDGEDAPPASEGPDHARHRGDDRDLHGCGQLWVGVEQVAHERIGLGGAEAQQQRGQRQVEQAQEVAQEQ